MKMKRLELYISFLVMMLSLAVVSDAQDKGPDPKTVHAEAIKKLDEYIAKSLHDWQVPGLSIAVVQEDQVLWSKGYGVRRVGGNEAVDQHTLFAIASNSKAFTAAALAILVDEGKIKWDDHVSKYLPWFKLKDDFATRDMRVRDLLCHRSGLGTFSGDLLWWGTSYSPKEILLRAAELEPVSAFRSEFGYSNLMYLAAGEVVVAASGQSWQDFIKSRILLPLNMNRSITSVRDLVTLDNYATPHKTLLDRSEPIAWMNWDAMAAAGGIISSADDMSHWLRLQLRQGQMQNGSRLFSQNASHEMWQSHTPLKMPIEPSKRFSTTHFSAYGLGWSTSDYHGKKVVGHSGGYDGMNSRVVLVPEEKLGVVVLTNSLTSISNLIAYAAIDAVLGVDGQDWGPESLEKFLQSRREFDANITKAITPAVQGTKPSHPLTDYTGNFRCPMYGDATIELDGDQLVLKLLPYPALVADLKHLHFDTFEIQWRSKFAWFEGGTAHFVADASGVFHKIELNVPNEDLFFHELKLKRY
jgi:CubicO group peptidase (beta-lactamase class C family)